MIVDTLVFKENCFFGYHKRGIEKFSYEDIQVVEYDKPLINVKFRDGKLVVKWNLYSFEETLASHFARINRQVVVNMKLVRQIVLENGTFWLLMFDGSKYRISRRRYKYVTELFLKHT